MMPNIRKWLNNRKFQVYLLAFILMVGPPIPMYLVAQRGANGWIWFLLGIVVLGNLLAISVP